MGLLIEVLFYLVLTLFIELLIAMALGFYNKKFIKILILLNLTTSPIFTILVYVYKHNITMDISVLILLLLQSLIIYFEFYVYKKYFSVKYSVKELLFSTFLLNAFSFVIYAFLQDVFVYLDIFQ